MPMKRKGTQKSLGRRNSDNLVEHYNRNLLRQFYSERLQICFCYASVNVQMFRQYSYDKPPRAVSTHGQRRIS